MLNRLPIIRWILGYRCFQQTVTLNDGAKIVQWYWIKPRAASRLKMYALGERWLDGRTVTDCMWERLR